jgi:hypothetical protein
MRGRGESATRARTLSRGGCRDERLLDVAEIGCQALCLGSRCSVAGRWLSAGKDAGAGDDGGGDAHGDAPVNDPHTYGDVDAFSDALSFPGLAYSNQD